MNKYILRKFINNGKARSIGLDEHEKYAEQPIVCSIVRNGKAVDSRSSKCHITWLDIERRAWEDYSAYWCSIDENKKVVTINECIAAGKAFYEKRYHCEVRYYLYYTIIKKPLTHKEIYYYENTLI